VARYLDQHAADLRLVRCSGGLAAPIARPLDLSPRKPRS
jgi:hypothetical protein